MPTNYQLLRLISNKYEISEDLQEEIYKRLLKSIQEEIIYTQDIYTNSRDMIDGELMWKKIWFIKEILRLKKEYNLTLEKVLYRFRLDCDVNEVWESYNNMVKEKYILSVEDHELLYPGKIDEMNFLLGNTFSSIRSININGIKLIIQHSLRLGSKEDCIIQLPKHTKKELFDKLDKAGISYKKNLKKKYLYELLGIPQSWSENQ